MTIPTSSDEVFNLVCPATSNAALGVTVPIPAPSVVVANIVELLPTFKLVAVIIPIVRLPLVTSKAEAVKIPVILVFLTTNSLLKNADP